MPPLDRDRLALTADEMRREVNGAVDHLAAWSLADRQSHPSSGGPGARVEREAAASSTGRRRTG